MRAFFQFLTTFVTELNKKEQHGEQCKVYDRLW